VVKAIDLNDFLQPVGGRSFRHLFSSEAQVRTLQVSCFRFAFCDVGGRMMEGRRVGGVP